MHERIIGLYQENALAWDRQRGRDLHERVWLDRFTRCCPRAARSSTSVADRASRSRAI
jgi:hypothetical protein